MKISFKNIILCTLLVLLVVVATGCSSAQRVEAGPISIEMQGEWGLNNIQSGADVGGATPIITNKDSTISIMFGQFNLPDIAAKSFFDSTVAAHSELEYVKIEKYSEEFEKRKTKDGTEYDFGYIIGEQDSKYWAYYFVCNADGRAATISVYCYDDEIKETFIAEVDKMLASIKFVKAE